jgi:hypothetical protein
MLHTSLEHIMHYKNGNVVAATSSIQSKEKIKSVLSKHFVS